MKQLLETSELKANVSQTCNKNEIQKLSLKVTCKQPQYPSLLSKVFIFSVILRYLTKYFCKHEIFLEYIVANMKV